MTADNNKLILAFGLTGLCFSFIAGGQILWKLGLEKVHISAFTDVLKFITGPYFIVGAVLYLGATAVWLYVLSRFEFSYVYPMASIGYVIALIMGRLIFHEVIHANRIIGVVVIIIGIIIIALR